MIENDEEESSNKRSEFEKKNSGEDKSEMQTLEETSKKNERMREFKKIRYFVHFIL